jgi:hypothetical protein
VEQLVHIRQSKAAGRSEVEQFLAETHLPNSSRNRERMMRNTTILLGMVLCICYASQGGAVESTVVGAGVFCETAEDMSRYIRAADAAREGQDDMQSAASRSQPQCSAAAASYVEREEVNEIQGKVLSFRIERVTVTALYRNGRLVDVEPHDEYIAVRELGLDV